MSTRRRAAAPRASRWTLPTRTPTASRSRRWISRPPRSAPRGRRLHPPRPAPRGGTGLVREPVLAAAAAAAAAMATAGVPVAGPCELVLSGEVLAEAWRVFASQADAVVERQGLTRYRERTPIAHGADQIAEPVSIASDGALEFGVLSEPLAEDGDAVRRFAIVERGIAVGLGLSPREAALRKRDPNGGVRNLVVTSGTWAGEAPAGARRRR